MTPDERQLLSGLFDRINAAANQPRDREAESFIADRVRSQPYAPYLLSQTVIVQEQALRAAAERIEQLEAQVRGGQQQQPAEETSFLGSIGKSLFGGAAASSQPRSSTPQAGNAWGQQSQGYPQQNTQPVPQQGGPWGQQGGQGFAPQQGYAPQQQAAPQGGGFLKGALGAAAGVAGGVLAADAISGLFRGHNNGLGIGGGSFGGGGQPGGETVVNNYYDTPNGGDGGNESNQTESQQDFLQDQSDDFTDNGGGSDDSYNV